MRLPARIGDTARSAEVSLGPISKGLAIAMGLDKMDFRLVARVAPQDWPHIVRIFWRSECWPLVQSRNRVSAETKRAFHFTTAIHPPLGMAQSRYRSW